MLKVASYNIRKCIGTDRRRNPDRTIDVLNEMDADIIALQEADRRFGGRAAAIPPLLLEMNSDYQAVPLDVQTDSMGWHGNALLVRKSARIITHDIVHIPCLEPRGAIMARIETGGMTLAIWGMHLDISGLWRRRQASAIEKLAREHGQDVPTVLMGDLNEWRRSGGCLKDFGRSYQFAPCGRSFHSRGLIAELDRIMHCRSIRVTRSGVLDSPSARKASDHLPIWAELEIDSAVVER
ncbi:Metal-dependent hydrolase, endonuclease/exonuclease/phosphatase family [Parasphingorhabdus marina DSM 22363]|uniref:Metal-dependent hydrolase, endonuclease/exonuclease/phosphatase family n=1 Tax=Parasphingorhabdus marina DSM 22363 TaxID=1123272 RepID=A0A1N6CQ46_9SPHN|nr:endonuclease/exonuclease/phosphatase family protein [Parasphingorhabdus marina]SIN60701.1 Metal-dependent hydrolase, endonuclease/exonuclease/phosphatase family [Parasphingorhabdus marina DSM 22363]